MITFFPTKKSTPEITTRTDSEFGIIQFIRSPRSRTIRIFVQPFQGIQIRMPHRLSVNEALKFADKKRGWIREALVRAKLTEEKSRRHFSITPQASRTEIRVVLQGRLEVLSHDHGFSFNKMSLRDQKSRWGSCSSQNNISLNQKLYYLPDHLRDYVLIHELAHTRVKNHGPHFWIILHNIFGRAETYKFRQELKDYDYLFHPPPADTSIPEN